MHGILSCDTTFGKGWKGIGKGLATVGALLVAAGVRDGMKTPTEDDTTSQIRAETNSQRQPRE